MGLLEPKKPQRDGWFKRLTTVFGGVFPFVALIVAIVWGISHCAAVSSGNERCDKQCVARGYPAGEVESVSAWKHTVCVCWPQAPAPAAYFLLERDE